MDDIRYNQDLGVIRSKILKGGFGMKPFRFLRIIGLIFLVTAVANLPALAQSIDASDSHGAGFYLVPGTIDKWGFNDFHSADRGWGIQMFNHYNMPLANPTINILGSSFSATEQYLAAQGQFFRYFHIKDNITLGFDSARTIEPLQIPAGASQYLQNVTVKVTPIDERYDPYSQPDISSILMIVTIGSKCESCVPSGTYYPPDWTNPNGRTEIWIWNPVFQQTYTFTASILVDNSSSNAINSKPRVGIMMNVYHMAQPVQNTSVDILDGTLSKVPEFGDKAYGVRYSVQENVKWFPRTSDESYYINYIELTETVTDSTPPVITPIISGSLGNNGWYISPVTVSWNISDPESGIASSAGGDPTTLTAYTPGTTLTCSATNGAGLSNSASVTIKLDPTSPAINHISVDNGELWPPNHKMVPVKVLVFASDTGSGIASYKIVSVTSNEPVDGLGDGDTSPDWQITGDLTVNLRAERSGTGTGRVYTITVLCMDKAGNSSTGIVTVAVPHDKGK
jgi:hypothetical protein